MGETYPFLYIDIEQQSPLQNSAMSYQMLQIGRVMLQKYISMLFLEWTLLEVLTILLMRGLIMDIVYYYLHSIEK